MRKLHRHIHHEISDAIVVATIVITGMLVFAAVFVGMTTPTASAEAEPSPGISVSVEITERPVDWDTQSPCWHPPYLPDQPHWTTCLFRRPAA